MEAALLTDVELLVTYNSGYTQGFNYLWPKFLFDYLVIKARDPVSSDLFSIDRLSGAVCLEFFFVNEFWTVMIS